MHVYRFAAAHQRKQAAAGKTRVAGHGVGVAVFRFRAGADAERLHGQLQLAVEPDIAAVQRLGLGRQHHAELAGEKGNGGALNQQRQNHHRKSHVKQ